MASYIHHHSHFKSSVVYRPYYVYLFFITQKRKPKTHHSPYALCKLLHVEALYTVYLFIIKCIEGYLLMPQQYSMCKEMIKTTAECVGRRWNFNIHHERFNHQLHWKSANSIGAVLFILHCWLILMNISFKKSLVACGRAGDQGALFSCAILLQPVLYTLTPSFNSSHN